MCKFIKNDGSKCKANAMSGSDYCYRHNLNVSDEEKRKASARGGEANRHLNGAFDEIAIEKPEDVKTLLIDTIINVRNGSMELKTANCIGYISNILVKVWEVAEIEKRISAIEKQIER